MRWSIKSRRRQTRPRSAPHARPCARRIRLWLELLEDRLVPSIYAVNSTGDTGTGSGLAGDLRYCITQADAVGGANVIKFDPQVFSTPQTITLLSPLPAITDDTLGIQGPGDFFVTISGNSAYPVFQITANDAAIADVTIANGLAQLGAGINFSGSGRLNLTGSTLSGNIAGLGGGAIRNGNATGTLGISDSYFYGNSTSGSGGAIINYGRLALDHCTLYGNTSSDVGGGISNVLGASATLMDYCTVNGNSATNEGGGLYNASGGMLKVELCTLTGDKVTTGAGGGGVANLGYATFIRDTISFASAPAGAGILNFGQATIRNTALQNNTANTGNGAGFYNDGAASYATLTSAYLHANYTILGDGGGIANAGTVTLTGCTVSANHAVSGGGIENAMGGFATVTSNSTVTNNVVLANGGGVDNAGMLTVTGSTLSSNSAGSNTNFGAGGGINNSGTVVLDQQATLSGNTASDGGGISNSGAVSASSATLSGNTVLYNGGGIYNSGTVSLTSCTLSGNTSTATSLYQYRGDGGAIDNSGFVGVYDSTVSGNLAPFGTLTNFGTAVLSGSTVSGNFDVGIANYQGGNMTLYDSTVTGNSDCGIAIAGNRDRFSTATLVNCTLYGNTATIGAGLYANFYSSTTLTNCTISGNTATVDEGRGGGGIYIFKAVSTSVTLNNTLVAGNTSGIGPDIQGSVNSNSASNLIGDGTEMTGISNGSNGNQVGSSGNPINPLLTSLGNYGGPTQTMKLMAGSPALGAGDASLQGLPTTDQRGFPRFRNGSIDIGAVEDRGGGGLANAVFASAFDTRVTPAATAGNLANTTATIPITSPDPRPALPRDARAPVADLGPPAAGATESATAETTGVSSRHASRKAAAPVTLDLGVLDRYFAQGTQDEADLFDSGQHTALP
jgi:hypothetical protein